MQLPKMKFLTATLLVACVVGFVVARSLQDADASAPTQSCVMDDFPVQENFNLQLFLGKWYEISWIPEEWFPPEYNFVDMLHMYTIINETYIDIVGAARKNPDAAKCMFFSDGLLLTDTPAKFLYDRVLNATARFQSDYWVMETDYVNYAFVFGCRGRSAEGVCQLPDAWVWSRSTTITDAQQALIDQKIADVCLTKAQFMDTDHDNPCKLSQDQ